MKKKLLFLFLGICLLLGICGKIVEKQNYEKYQRYWEAQRQQQEQEEALGTDEEIPETEEFSGDLQTISYDVSVDGWVDFTLTFDNAVVYAAEDWGDPTVYSRAKVSYNEPSAYMSVREGNWEEQYNNPESRYKLECDIKNVSEASPLSINGYDGYYWTTYVEETAIDWNNDIYMYVIQLDSEHYFYLETSRLTLNDECTFEELLKGLIYNIEIP